MTLTPPALRHQATNSSPDLPVRTLGSKRLSSPKSVLDPDYRPPTSRHAEPCQSYSGWRPRPPAAYSGITIPRFISKLTSPFARQEGENLSGRGVDIDPKPWILLQGPSQTISEPAARQTDYCFSSRARGTKRRPAAHPGPFPGFLPW